MFGILKIVADILAKTNSYRFINERLIDKPIELKGHNHSESENTRIVNEEGKTKEMIKDETGG